MIPKALRRAVVTDTAVVTSRPDQSLYFANARFVEAHTLDRVRPGGPFRDVVPVCSAIIEIVLSAVETPDTINTRLDEMGVRLHLSEVKGPVMDRLRRAHFLSQLTGDVHLAQYDAFVALLPDAA